MTTEIFALAESLENRFSSRWKLVSRKKAEFLSETAKRGREVPWILQKIGSPAHQCGQDEDDDEDEESDDTERGDESEISFLNLSDRDKRRKTQQLTEEFTWEELLFSAKTKLNIFGKRAGAKILDHVLNGTNEELVQMLNCIEKGTNSTQKKKKLTPMQALAFQSAGVLSKAQYMGVREYLSDVLDECFLPGYKTITKARKLCTPSSAVITETKSAIALTDALSHQTKSLLAAVGVDSNIPRRLKLYASTGEDGFKNVDMYNQK